MRNPLSFQTNRLPRVSRRELIKSFMSPPKPIRSTRSEHPMAPCCLAETSELRFPRVQHRLPLDPLVRMSESTVLRSSTWRRTHYMSIAYTLISGNQTYQLFALNLNDLTNKIPPVTIAASHTLSDGTTYNFNAAISTTAARAALGVRQYLRRIWQFLRWKRLDFRVAGFWDGRQARWLRSRRTG